MQAGHGRRRAAGHRLHRGNRGIDGKAPDERTHVADPPRVEGWLHPLRGHRRNLRLSRGAMAPRLGKGLVDAGTQVRRRGHGGPEQRQGHERVRVDGEDRHLGLPGQRRGLARHDEAGEVVGDHEGGPARETEEEPPRGFRRRLHEGPVVEPPLARGAGVGRHAFEDELVQAAGRPGVVEPQALVDHEGSAQLGRALERVVEGVVVVEAPIGLHPVEHELPAGRDLLVVEAAQARRVVAHGPIVPGSRRRARSCLDLAPKGA